MTDEDPLNDATFQCDTENPGGDIEHSLPMVNFIYLM